MGCGSSVKSTYEPLKEIQHDDAGKQKWDEASREKQIVEEHGGEEKHGKLHDVTDEDPSAPANEGDSKVDAQIERASNLLYQLGHGEDVDDLLREVGMSGALGQPCGSGKVLMVVYTDLEPGSCMGIVQLWRWKAKIDLMVGQPLIIHHANFEVKDSGGIFEKKQLISRLMFGAIDVHVLTHEGDQGGAAVDDDEAGSLRGRFAMARDRTIAGICEKLSSFSGQRIDWYFLSPGAGNIAGVLDQLKQMKSWPLAVKSRVTICSNSYNLRGMHRADLEALEEISRESESPMVDLNSSWFFEHVNSIADLTDVGFPARLKESHPLLVAAMRLFYNEVYSHSVHPESASIFLPDSALSEEEKQRFTSIEKRFEFGHNLGVYAAAFFEDPVLLAKVAPNIRTMLQILANGGADAPFCDQLPFIFEYLQRTHPQSLKQKTGSWYYDQAAGKTSIDVDGSGLINAVRPTLLVSAGGTPGPEFSACLEEYLVSHLSSVEEANICCQGGNLCFAVSEELSTWAQTVIDRFHAGEALDTLLSKAGVRLPEFGAKADSDAKRLIVVYTDLEPVASMSIAQLLQWKAKIDGKRSKLFVIQHTNFDSKDQGKVFEMKHLVARLVLGPVNITTLTHEGDQGGAKFHGDMPHPKALRLQLGRQGAIHSISKEIASFTGECIDWYVLSAGSGNLASIMTELEMLKAWPLKPKLEICLYSGAYNIRGMRKDDVIALEKMAQLAASPPIVVDKESFFGGRDFHPWTGTLATFASDDFAKSLGRKVPFLAAALKLCSDEFNKRRVLPEASSLFEGVLHEDEKQRFKAIARSFGRGTGAQLKEYAAALLGDEELFAKMDSSKKHTIRALAYGGCDFSLSDQVPFLAEWSRSERPDWISTSIGPWSCNPARGTSEVRLTSFSSDVGRPQGTHLTLANPRDEVMLAEMRHVLSTYLDMHFMSRDV